MKINIIESFNNLGRTILLLEDPIWKLGKDTNSIMIDNINYPFSIVSCGEPNLLGKVIALSNEITINSMCVE